MRQALFPSREGIKGCVGAIKLALLLAFVLSVIPCFTISSTLYAQQQSKDTLYETPIPVKDWWEYSDSEKKILRDRWTEGKTLAVVKALQGRRGLPDAFQKVPFSGKDTASLSQDLRGIDLSPLQSGLTGKSIAALDTAELGGANLQGANLRWTNLDGASLHSANLEGASLFDASLRGTRLTDARLERADLTSARLQGAFLLIANLHEAELIGANLRDARLRWADLEGAVLVTSSLRTADLSGANVRNADVFGAIFDSTYLFQTNLGEAKNVRYIVWGDTVESRFVIGEEKFADSTNSRNNFRKAEITYRDLKSWYREEVLYDIAAEFHYRENEVITKRYLKCPNAFGDYGIWLFRYLFLKLTYGYGSRPLRLLPSSVVIILLFAAIFVILTIPRSTKSGIYAVREGRRGESDQLLPLHWWRLPQDCFYFSLLSFATFGYGALQPRQWLQFFRLQPVEFKAVGWARIFVGIEAALGIWIFALLVTVLFGKG